MTFDWGCGDVGLARVCVCSDVSLAVGGAK